ncbi:hypothetical protein HHK36_004666 [Tetracentron sinense]|uniref:Protein kinase domain-containing protein n=1 Tax=Tetracentron sinense TaxID=13715 RepID=A0A835DLK8_TETSI|nr:hypothetical protein HHK36_004666 [Tetracentron sinense]
MERIPDKGTMEQSKIYEQFLYDFMETGNEGLVPAGQTFVQDPSSSINTNLRPPEFNVSGGPKPVLNYSIQTGEEFAFEFMRERTNPKKHFIPNAAGDPNSATGYMDLKGILGITHTGSESGSDISMHTTVEKGRVKEFDRKGSSVNEDNSYYGSVQSVPRTSAGNDSSRGFAHGYVSSGASDSSSSKLKFLCSFGGKILPRPSDGKLRYVGGETRIIRISKHISWQELMQKTLTIYNQAHAIKYQLPEEDLDALVSVSCDEDLHNMMEEFNLLEDREGAQKLRMFLFSTSDLDDAHFGLGSTKGDSEIQYVVAVNGMDLGSRKNSIALGLTNTSANNLDELLSLNVEMGTGKIATAESAEVNTSPLTGIVVPSLTYQSSQPMLPSSSCAYETQSQLYEDHVMPHGEADQYSISAVHPLESSRDVDGRTAVPSSVPSQYGYSSHPSNYAPFGENSVPMPLHGLMTQQGALAEGQIYRGFRAHDPEMLGKEAKLKVDGSAQQKNEPEMFRSSENDYLASSQQYDGYVPNYIPVEEVSVAISAPERGAPLLPLKNNGMNQEPVQVPMHPDAVNAGQSHKSIEDDHFHLSVGALTHGYADSEADSTEFSYHELTVLPQRVFHSERIPREQAELLNRLSKSDDSFGSQFLIHHLHSDLTQQDPITESVDKLHDGNLASQTEQAISSAKPLYTYPQTIEDGSVQFEKYKQLADGISQMNSTFSEEGLESKFKKSELNSAVPTPVDNKAIVNDDRVRGIDHEMARVKDNHKEFSVDETETTGSEYPSASQGTCVKHQEDPASSLPEQWGGMATKDATNNSTRNAYPFAQLGTSPGVVSRGESSVGIATPEHGDILIDINDRFPRDFLSDIFSKAIISEDSSGISPLHNDGTGLSLNMENNDPKHWSFFQKLVQDEFVRKNVSLMDQDHLGYSSPLTKVEEEAPRAYHFSPSKIDGVSLGHLDSQINFDEEIQKESSSTVGTDTIGLHQNYNPSQIKETESVQFDDTQKNPRTPESEYEDGKLETENIGGASLDPSLEDFDISTLQIIMNEDLEELRELGSGTFGTVYHGKWRGTDVAIKRIKKSCFTGRSSEQERLTVEFWREADILSKLHHPNVVAFYGVVQDGPGATMATVTEFMVNGSLRHVLVRKDRYLERRKRLIIAMDAAFGMEYLHSKNIVHFDLKCDNLLVNLKDPLRPICKVGDFGLSKIKRNTLVTGGVRGTLPWMAPELLNGSSSKVSEKVDVFSFGIVLWEILTGEEPYANMHYGAIIGGIVNNTLRPHVPNFCDTEWRMLMEQCWAPDPLARPSFTEIASRLRVMSAASQTKPQNYQAPK